MPIGTLSFDSCLFRFYIMNYKIIYITLLSSLLLTLAACSTENDIEPQLVDSPITLSYKVSGYTHDGVAFRATSVGSTAEQEINNLYLFLFDDSGANPIRYYINATIFDGGSWTNNSTEKKVSLQMTQAEAGVRQVYLVANIDATLQTKLDNVATVVGLQSVFRETAQPWSTNISSPILMSGSATHNFITQGAELSSVNLIRAIAKIELNVKLSSGFQVVPTVDNGGLSEYRFRYVNFDKHMYVEKHMPTKPASLASSSGDSWPNTGSWTPWSNSLDDATPPDTGIGYTVDGDNKVTTLRLITYLNERDETGAAVEIELPRVDGGPLPPPEFGPELYRLPLPAKIERNTWYVYDIEI